MGIKPHAEIAMLLFGVILCVDVASVKVIGQQVKRSSDQEKIAYGIDQKHFRNTVARLKRQGK